MAGYGTVELDHRVVICAAEHREAIHYAMSVGLPADRVVVATTMQDADRLRRLDLDRRDVVVRLRNWDAGTARQPAVEAIEAALEDITSRH